MRIVMLTDDKNIDRRILLEAETLCAYGHEVIILSAWQTGLARHELYGKIKIERVSSRTSKIIINKAAQSFIETVKKIIVRKSISLITFSYGAITSKIRKLTLYDEVLFSRACYFNPDLIHVHDLPQLRVGTLVKKKLKIPLIYDAHELYPEINTLNRYQRKHLSKLEKNLIAKCNEIITVNSFIAKEMSRRYKIKMPHVILNATRVPPLFCSNKKYDLFREKFSLTQDKKIVLFQGWISKTRGLQPLVTAMLQVVSHVHLVFMGYGEAISELKALTKSINLEERIHFMEAVPQSELLYWTASADVGIIPYQPIDLNNYYCSPNKLFEFIQARLPIIANDLPFLRQVVHGEEFGLIGTLNSPESYADVINKMFKLEEEKPGYFKSNLNVKAAQYSWDKEEKKLYRIYTQFIFPRKINDVFVA